ncbi:MAG: aldo/keto reductase [Ponticaulis sp.]|nr:aldo/keto reductase [Ponticaulis sp.]
MEYRQLGRSGLRVSELSFGAGTFGGSGPLFSHWGTSEGAEARRIIDICIAHGVNLFDTADVYSDGASETVLGEAIKGRRDKVLLSTKLALPMGDGPNDYGTSRHRLTAGTEASLKRLGTDHIDVLQLHGFDASTPVEEVMKSLDQLVRSGKVRYVGVSNFAAWQIMKSLAVSDRYGLERYVANQAYYSLIGRDYEWDLMPLAECEGLGGLIWSPLGWGRLTGKIRRGTPLPETSRLHNTADFGPPVDEDRLYDIVDAMQVIADETGRSIPQIALNWLLQRPTVSSVIIGARTEKQLLDNLGAVGWSLTSDQMARLNEVSDLVPPYPHFAYRNQQGFAKLNPPAV